MLFYASSLLFSAPEPFFGSSALLWSRVVHQSSLTFHMFDFPSETVDHNSTKLDRKQDLKVLYKVCVFQADWKNKMGAPASDWMRHDFFS